MPECLVQGQCNRYQQVREIGRYGMEKVLVSVIMSVYNPDERQLLKAVNSIIEQSFTDWELLIHDDGSDSEYIDLIAELSQLDSRISCYRSEDNQGLAKGLNRCINLAKGRYIARMDCDDISLKERLKAQVEFLDKNPSYCWVGTSAYLLSGSNYWGVRRPNEVPGTKDFLRYSPYIHPTVMFRKEALTDNKGYNTSRLTSRCEDYELFSRLHVQGHQGYNLKELLFAYREDHHSYKRRTLLSRLREAQVRYKIFKDMGLLTVFSVPYVIRPILGILISVFKILHIRMISAKI
jgi:glycosyltransferase involved in cell wall biosynthesis